MQDPVKWAGGVLAPNGKIYFYTLKFYTNTKTRPNNKYYKFG
jgi:hypothetical protein